MFIWNKKVTAPLFFVICVFLLWQTIILVFRIPPWLLPSPATVAATFWDVLPLLFYHSQNTLLAAGSGLIAAVILALGLGMIMEFSPWVKQGIYPLIVVSQTIPIISIAPLFIIWLGFGLLPKVVVVALICFFPVAVSTVEGMNAADPDMVNLLRVMGSSRWQIIKLVRLPAALPSFFAGLKIAGTYAVMGAIIGEWLGATKGIGVFMTRASYAYQLDKVLAAIIIISLVSLLIFGLIELAARLIMPWYYKERGSN